MSDCYRQNQPSLDDDGACGTSRLDKLGWELRSLAPKAVPKSENSPESAERMPPERLP